MEYLVNRNIGMYLKPLKPVNSLLDNWKSLYLRNKRQLY